MKLEKYGDKMKTPGENILVTKQIFMVLVLSTGLLNHVVIIPFVLNAASRDAWISAILSILPLTLFAWMVFFIIKKTNQQNMFDWWKNHFGKNAAIAYLIPILLFLYVSTYLTLKDTTIWVSIYFVKDTPSIFTVVLFLFLCYLGTRLGLKTLAISSGIILPIVIFLGFFIAAVNTTQKDVHLLFPLFTDGFKPVLQGLVYVLAGLFELFIVILLVPNIHNKIKYRHILLLSFIYLGLLLGPLTGAIMEFGPVEGGNFRYPAYEQWRLLKIGNFISHLDFFALYQWLSGALIRISLFIILISYTIPEKKRAFAITALYGGLFILELLPLQSDQFYQLIYKYFFPSLPFFFLSMCLIFMIMIFIAEKRGKQHEKTEKEATHQN